MTAPLSPELESAISRLVHPSDLSASVPSVLIGDHIVFESIHCHEDAVAWAEDVREQIREVALAATAELAEWAALRVETEIGYTDPAAPTQDVKRVAEEIRSRGRNP